ncbi:class I SAM-dependent methyltransferase [Lichenihabitans psoromatis]|uniref:class I SAM-dependent methyltransferase n=1 Tax=Lichenihabitans psoromatis TaxID=2528642 RepID=UPI0013F17E56|nr:class I SAM-dependent methyltransferase [Lichenihabitans psoromatis]
MPKRPKVRCVQCGSLERTRVAALHIAEFAPANGSNILHFAPERGLSALLQTIGGASYRAVDIDPSRYPGLGVEPFDLCRDVFALSPGTHDLIVHNHVLEHIECNYSAVLIRLAKALKPGGRMMFSMPILPGSFTDELMNGTIADKQAKFGDMIHVRRFGVDFLQQTIGMIFTITDRYDLPARFGEAALIEANIPEHHWHGYTGASIFNVSQADLRV